ncbi:tRNA(Ile)-lysidine synthase [Firmicutes bacterium CAG:345]|nr:tRNA(Ile)-lysidine synthase [Firmicutes bacterium CAG:345]
MKFSRLQKSLSNQNITAENEIPVAFSGGPDSIFLTEGLIKLGYKPLLIYINYHDSPTVYIEEKIVKQYSQINKLKLIEHEVNIPDNVNFEDEARKIRYKFFSDVIKIHPNKFILTAHHKNDDIETMILQINRNNIVDYYGLKEKNDIFGVTVIRPILNYTKLEIIEYLTKNNISFYDDPTNYEQERQRNILRANLKNIDYNHYKNLKISLNQKVKEEKNKIKNIANGKYISKKIYSTLNDNEKKRLLNFLLNYNLGYSNSNLINICLMRLKSNKSFEENLKNNISLFQDKNNFFFGTTTDKRNYSYIIEKEGYYKFKEFDIEIKLGNFNIKDFPIFIETPKQKDIIETNIKQNNVIKFLKHHNVPNFLINIFPIIKNKDKKIIYVPFYEDIIENKIKINLKLITLKEHKDGKDVLVFYPF